MGLIKRVALSRSAAQRLPILQIFLPTFLYRYLYYKNSSLLALQTAVTFLEKIKKKEKIPSEWAQLKSRLVSGRVSRQI
jgi:hypothetical protein